MKAGHGAAASIESRGAHRGQNTVLSVGGGPMETNAETGQGLEQSKSIVRYGKTGVARTGRPALPVALDRSALALGAAVLGVLAAGGVALARALQHNAAPPSPALEPFKSESVTPALSTTDMLGSAYSYSCTYEYTSVSIVVREGT